MPTALVPLKDCLIYLTKADMCTAAEMLGERIPKSWAKARAAERLDAIYRDHKADLYSALSSYALQVSSGLLRSYPSGAFPLDIAIDGSPVAYQIYQDHMNYYALADYRDERFVLSDFAYELVQKYAQARYHDVARGDLMEECALTLIRLYGAMDENELIREMSRLFDGAATAHMTRFIQMRTGICLYSERIPLDAPKSIWRCHPHMSELRPLIEKRNAHPGLHYKPFTIADLKCVDQENYSRLSSGFAALESLMAAHGISHLAIREKLGLLFFVLQRDDALYNLPLLASWLFYEDDIPDPTPPPEATEAMLEAFETIPRWSLKGHSIREQIKATSRPHAKVIPFADRRAEREGEGFRE